MREKLCVSISRASFVNTVKLFNAGEGESAVANLISLPYLSVPQDTEVSGRRFLLSVSPAVRVGRK